MDENAGGRRSRAWPTSLREDVIRHALLFLGLAKTLRLKIEHRAVAAMLCHQLVVCPELDDLSVLENTDAVRLANGREAVRNENRRAVPSRGQDALEDLCFAAYIELRGRFVEQDEPGALSDG